MFTMPFTRSSFRTTVRVAFRPFHWVVSLTAGDALAIALVLVAVYPPMGVQAGAREGVRASLGGFMSPQARPVGKDLNVVCRPGLILCTRSGLGVSGGGLAPVR